MQKLLFLFSFFILSTSCFSSTKLIIQTNDNEQFEYKTEEEKKILMQSQTISNIVGDMDTKDDNTIPLPEISAQTFKLIIECLQLLNPIKELEGLDKIEQKLKITTKLKSYDKSKLMDFIQATSYLDIGQLCSYGCKVWDNDHEPFHFKNDKYTFNNAEIIDRLRQISFSKLKKFFIPKYFKFFKNKKNSFKTPTCLMGYQDNLGYIFDNSARSIYIFMEPSEEPILAQWTKQWISYFLYGHENIVNSTCFNLNKKLIASASDDKTILIWDHNDHNYIKKLEDKDNNSEMDYVCFSPNNNDLASISRNNIIYIWNTETGSYRHKIKDGHKTQINSIRFNFDGAKFASCSDDATIKIWNTPTAECLQILKSDLPVTFACFSPNEKDLASVLNNGNIDMWNTNTGSYIKTLKKTNLVAPKMIDYNADGDLLTFMLDDKTIIVYHLDTDYHLKIPVKKIYSPVHSAYFSPNENKLVYGPSTNKIHDTNENNMLKMKTWNINTIKNLLTNKLKTKQAFLYSSCKEALENQKTIYIRKNPKLFTAFNSLEPTDQTFLQQVTKNDLPLKGKILYQLRKNYQDINRENIEKILHPIKIVYILSLLGSIIYNFTFKSPVSP